MAELDENRIQDTLARLPEDLRRSWDPLIHSLTEEMKEDYLLSVKKAIGKQQATPWIVCPELVLLVDFVLRDPREPQTDVKEETLPHRQEIAVLPKPWHSSFVQAQKFVEKNLHAINPAMAEVLSKWHKNIFKCVSLEQMTYRHCSF